MKTGKSIVELAQQLQDIRDNSKDFIVPTEKLSVKVIPPMQGDVNNEATPFARPVIEFTNGKRNQFELNPWSNKQLAQYAEIPQGYYDRIQRENPFLFADNVNHGLKKAATDASQAHKSEARMIRTYGNTVRALVSNKYRRLDCVDLLETVFPLMIENGLEVMSSEITDRRMYIQAVSQRITSEVKVGDKVQYGLVISSSDVGAGSVRVEPLVYRLVCTNGMISNAAIRKFHIGRSQGDDDVYEMLTEDTQNLTDRAFWAQVKDIVTASMRGDIFEKQVDRLRIAANEKIQNFDIPQVIELASKHVGVTNEGLKHSMVSYLANGADGAGLTKWGLANAFTYAAGLDEINYDDAIDLQRAGSKIIDLPARAWHTISTSPA